MTVKYGVQVCGWKKTRNQKSESLISKFQPRPDDMFILESAKLRQIRDIIDKDGVHAAKEHVLESPSPKLWRILGEAALEIVELNLAEECFIHCRDYHTIKTIVKLKKITNRHVQRAHIAAHFGRHDEAEELFRAEDRTDLATEHKKVLGDEVKVRFLKIIKK